MKKITCVVLGLAFMALGILGITGVVTMFQSDPVYLNIAEIILGSLGFIVGVFARMDTANYSQKIASSQRVNDIDQQRRELEQQRKELDQQRKDIDQKKKDLDQEKKDLDQEKKDYRQEESRAI